jgi:hypothetical protein
MAHHLDVPIAGGSQLFIQREVRCGQPAPGLVTEQRLARSYDHLGQRQLVLYE